MATSNYYVKASGVTLPQVQSTVVNKKITDRSGVFSCTVFDEDGSQYAAISVGDEFTAFRTSDDLKIFGGYVDKVKRVSKKGFSFSLTGGDYTKKLNHIRVDSEIYEGREFSVVIRDSMHKHICDSDLIENCDAVGTWAVAGDAANLSADVAADGDGHLHSRLGPACLKFDVTFAGGTGTLTDNITSIDFADTDWLCFYFYIADLTKITDLDVNFGQNAGAYYNLDVDTSELSNGWNFIYLLVSNKTVGAGAPALAAVDWLQFEVTEAAAAVAEVIRIDDIRLVHTGFNANNVTTTTNYVEDVKFSNQTVFRCIKDIKEIKDISYDFFIDVNKSLNFGIYGTSASGVTLEKGVNIISSDFWDDDDKLVNDLKVFAGKKEYNDFKEFSGNAALTDFQLTYEPISSEVYVGGAIQKGYEEDMTTAFDYHFETREDNTYWIVFEVASTPGVGVDNIDVHYTYGVPIIIRKTDDASIANYGLRKSKIEKSNIKDYEDAINIASDILSKYSEPIINGKVVTSIQPTIDVGETVDVVDARFFAGTQTMTVVAVTHGLVGKRLRTTVTLTSFRKGVEDYLNDILARLNALEEKDKGDVELSTRLVEFAEDLALTDDPATNLTINQRTVNSTCGDTWFFGAPCLFSTPIKFGGGSGKYGANLVTNPSS